MGFMDVYNKLDTSLGYGIITYKANPNTFAEIINDCDTVLLISRVEKVGTMYGQTLDGYLLFSKKINGKKYDIIYHTNMIRDNILWASVLPKLNDHKIDIVTKMAWTSDKGISETNKTKRIPVDDRFSFLNTVLEKLYKPIYYDIKECQDILKKYDSVNVVEKDSVAEELGKKYPGALEYHVLKNNLEKVISKLHTPEKETISH